MSLKKPQPDNYEQALERLANSPLSLIRKRPEQNAPSKT